MKVFSVLIAACLMTSAAFAGIPIGDGTIDVGSANENGQLPILKENKGDIKKFLTRQIFKAEETNAVETEVSDPTCQVNNITVNEDRQQALSRGSWPRSQPKRLAQTVACVTNFSTGRWNGSDYTVFLLENNKLTRVLYKSGTGSY